MPANRLGTLNHIPCCNTLYHPWRRWRCALEAACLPWKSSIVAMESKEIVTLQMGRSQSQNGNIHLRKEQPWTPLRALLALRRL